MKEEYEVEVAENAGDQRIPLTTTLTSNGTLMMLHISLYPCIITLHLLLALSCMVLLTNPIFVSWNQSKIRLSAFA